MSNEPSGSNLSTDATVLAQQRTSLALERTRIAVERTLMAWIRTSISMIGFGFTIYKFFQYLSSSEKVVIGRPYTVRNLGLALILVGTISLIAASAQHWQTLNSLRTQGAKIGWSLALMVAAFVILIGVIAFIGVFAKTGPF